jgi:hypothetical protein
MAKRKRENKVFLIRYDDSVIDKRYLTRVNAFKYAMGLINCPEVYVYEIDLNTHEMNTWMKIGAELKPLTEEAKLLYGR